MKKIGKLTIQEDGDPIPEEHARAIAGHLQAIADLNAGKEPTTVSDIWVSVKGGETRSLMPKKKGKKR